MNSPADYYRTNPQRRGLLGHISFGVKSYQRSKTFYTALLAPLGVRLVYDNPARTTLGYGFDENHELLNIFEHSDQAHPPGKGCHLAFNAPSRKAVREFWEAGCSNGGVSDGEPGVRKHYGPFYYAAFLLDPDGYRLEVVYQEEDKEP
ncbi:Glyoxalase/Bleomycin resistance protein/Dihydroxybiphenyl dioxygenase [Bisporella sp. PMI_857]|nr:Glyoxalase/Bleomycin resistance protein/Dihydroxybiphenyl dioxygenase [Bisporella sp. PMI_857]